MEVRNLSDNSPPTTIVSTPPRKRRRAKLACDPCRSRKRKCDGHLPCETCIQFEYDCYYGSTTASKKPTIRGQSSEHEHSHISTISPVSDHNVVSATKDTPTNRLTSPAISNNANSQMESLEANSGAAFVRRLGLKIDPSNAPRLHLFAWNTGERLAGCPIYTKVEMKSLALIYFDKVAYAYGFIDRDIFFQRLEERWGAASLTKIDNDDTYDPVFCGVAALGLLFSQKFPSVFEPDLVETARVLLEQHSLSTPPSLDTVTGWVLRVAYLRMTSLPHITWLASCSLMHAVEAARIHLESPSRTVFEGSSSEYENIDLDIRRRLWGMAQHLNIWASFDLGRTKITLSGASTKPFTPKAGDHTSELLAFIPLTEPLDPNKTRSVEDLEADLTRVLDEDLERPPVIMAQVNLTLCIFRRLRAQKSHMLSLQADRILELVIKGLRAARQMVVDCSPWHHVANVPFQVVCLLLAIDSRASLALLGDAMGTLQLVANMWNSAVMREAYNTAYLLILLHQRRKEEDAKALRDVLSMHSTAPAMTAVDSSSTWQFGGFGNNQHSGYQHPPQTMMTATAADSAEFSWLENLISDMPSLREFDLEQFLVQDATQPQEPEIATGFAPDLNP
ncbi:C6 transcription factor, putative [Talaromyces stipitatus ATCC 10500]|uniref:C6 transcription factor, putative n=1 Tax=Talaromyces stipitatus (strain ATCC 10500 / CBS 375.48 / QM 6759 / NRRL 1006) TaxID=441959 RepID=B8MGB4_TALSN|nr:C6 transcription factor, putative [Talaromyces stipitatus ATCC 10500]EED16234.1 C6 transcription factor, putative [Talaromyces stipitatus ATCC 10500]